MGNKAEITNLIGRKGSKMTVKSNVKTLALKVYDEQIKADYNSLKRGQGDSPCDEYLSVASVAKTTFRYKEQDLNEVYGRPCTPYLGYKT